MAERVLLVDDDLDTLRLVGVMLQRQGYQIIAANNGQQALLLAEKEKPDLVLLDVMMPDMDGYEVARKLRSNPLTINIPIIMFSAKGQVDDKVLGFEAGADDYLTKPTQPRELFAHVKAVLSRTRGAKETQKTTRTDVKDRGAIIGVMAARGGLGVTTIALNLGISIEQLLKKEVIIADLRPGQGSIGVELGYLNAVGLSNLMQRNINELSLTDIEKELISYSPGIRLLLSSNHPLNTKFLLQIDYFELIVEKLATITSYLILDMGNNLYPFSGKVLNLLDELILVIEPNPLTMKHTKTLIDDLTSLGVGEGRFKFVMVSKLRSSVQLTISEIEQQLGRPITMTFTPAPELAFYASTNQKAMILQQPESMTTRQFNQLAEIITNPHVKVE
jgi:CheY-like chemotaxis protein